MKIKLLDELATVPQRGSSAAAGYDLYAVEPVIIQPNTREVIRTGICLEIPRGFFGQIAPRSGLAVKSGIMTMAGIIDPDYRGEIKVVLYNSDSAQKFVILPGDRIAQLIIKFCYPANFEVVSELSDTTRADGGFGSTGIH